MDLRSWELGCKSSPEDLECSFKIRLTIFYTTCECNVKLMEVKSSDSFN
jgi:hypothetical protein